MRSSHLGALLAGATLFSSAACGVTVIEVPADVGPRADTGSVSMQDSGTAGHPDAGMMMGGEDASEPTPDSGMMMGNTTIQAGDVSGSWCGMIQVLGSISLPAGQSLEICGGSTIAMAGGSSFTVAGTLHFGGDATNRITLNASGAWIGIIVAGTGVIDGAGLDMNGANVCLDGRAGSSITLDASSFISCVRSMRLQNGATFTHVRVEGGSQLSVTGGTLTMTDSVIDMHRPEVPPDCTDWAGGSAILDHVQFTNCHCPLHFNSATGMVSVTNSIFDGAANAVMLAGLTVTFRGNNFLSTEVPMLDIGGGIHAAIGGNYWGGGAPGLGTNDRSQFTGTTDFSATPIPGAGPR